MAFVDSPWQLEHLRSAIWSIGIDLQRHGSSCANYPHCLDGKNYHVNDLQGKGAAIFLDGPCAVSS